MLGVLTPPADSQINIISIVVDRPFRVRRTDKYFRAVPTVEAGDDLNAEFREDAARKPILEGAVVQWIVVCLCGSPEEVGRQLVSTTSTYPEADKIVLIANGFGLSGRQLAELRTLVSNQARAPVQLESTLAVVSPEQVLLVAWEVLPVGAKVVAYCIRECEVRSRATACGNVTCKVLRYTQAPAGTGIIYKYIFGKR